ncbi:class I SAM-dependent methyltransferase [Roseomonas sp. F4]
MSEAAGTMDEVTSPAEGEVDTSDPRFFVPTWGGDDYITVLRQLHRMLKPKAYLEIGVQKGGSFRHATCPSIAVDPVFELGPDITKGRPVSLLFRMGSDDFFASYDPKVLLQSPIDLAFLDGMHLSEFLLRDFYNAEAHCHEGSVIVLHDMLPTDVGMASRESPSTRERLQIVVQPTRDRKRWSGDVWKILPILRKYRPELRILCLDAPPTGLVLVAGLQPRNRVLLQNYVPILEEFSKMDLAAIGLEAFIAAQGVEPTSAYLKAAAVTARLGLD